MTTYYVDATNGDDSKAGTSIANAWKTIAKVNGFTFAASDSILFKRNETWREHLIVPRSSLTIGAYGTGERPRILGGTELVGATWAQPAPTGSVSQANMKLSTVNGTAFVDFGVADVLTDHLGEQIVIEDSAGKQLIGYIKAAGAGETYGSELLANTTFENTTGVTPDSGVTIQSVAGGESGNCLQVDVQGFCEEDFTVTAGMLLTATCYIKKGTNDSGYVTFANNGPSVWNEIGIKGLSSSTSWTQKAARATAEVAATRLILASDYTSGTALFDTATAKQITAPSATGVTITSTADGSTYNWTSMESGFDLNDPSGYVYTLPGTVVENVWWASCSTEAGIVVYDNGDSVGEKQTDIASLGAQGDWFWGSSKLYVYSTVTPATMYTSVETGDIDVAGIYVDADISGIVIEDFNVRYCGYHGISHENWSGTTSGFTVQRCEVAFCGYADAGNGIHAYSGTMSNVVIQRNHVTDCYDTGIAVQDGQASTFTNVLVSYNLIERCEHGIELGGFANGTNVNGLYVYNNTILDSGTGFSHTQRVDPYGDGIIMWASTTSTITDLKVKNNIIYNCIYPILKGHTNFSGNNTWDYNCYYPDGTVFGYDNWPMVGNYDFAGWKTATSQDAHSVASDPLFVSSTDFNIQASSPANNTGVDVALLTDYEGDSVGSPPDMGAFESDEGSEVITITGGLTLGGWFKSAAPQAEAGLMGQYVVLGNRRSYLLHTVVDVPTFTVSTDGTATVAVSSTVTHDHDLWFFTAARFSPSTELAVWCNDTKTVNTVGVPASLYSSTAAFKIGTYDAVYFNGKASLCWVCAEALSDDIVMSIYESQRALFGQGPEMEL